MTAEATALEMEVHPAAKLFPQLEGEDLQTLAADIKARGLIHPIVIHEGKILDGRNRYAACRKVDVEPRTVEWDGSGGSPTQFVMSLNIHRRHLSVSQRAVIALDLLPMLEAEARERQGKRRDLNNISEIVPGSGCARDIAAELLKVNAHYVSDAKRLAQERPELLELVRSGKKTIAQAKRKLKRLEKEENQKKKGAARKLAPAEAQARARSQPHDDGLVASPVDAVTKTSAERSVQDPDIDGWEPPEGLCDSLLSRYRLGKRMSANNLAGDDRALVVPNPGATLEESVREAHNAARTGGATVVALLPVETDSDWWHDYVLKADEIQFLRGRLPIREEGEKTLPFASVVVIWNGPSPGNRSPKSSSLDWQEPDSEVSL